MPVFGVVSIESLRWENIYKQHSGTLKDASQRRTTEKITQIQIELNASKYSEAGS